MISLTPSLLKQHVSLPGFIQNVPLPQSVVFASLESHQFGTEGSILPCHEQGGLNIEQRRRAVERVHYLGVDEVDKRDHFQTHRYIPLPS